MEVDLYEAKVAEGGAELLAVRRGTNLEMVPGLPSAASGAAWVLRQAQTLDPAKPLHGRIIAAIQGQSFWFGKMGSSE